MRSILYRGKPMIGEKSWVYGVPVPTRVDTYSNGGIELVKYVNYDVLDNYEPSYESCDIAPETLGQFTGLTDRKGQKIFEGDIVQWHNQFYPICWIDKYARFAAKPEGAVFAVVPFDQGEVVGNIYDNPDLANGIMLLKSAVCTVELPDEMKEKLKDLFAACAGNEDKKEE